MEKRKERALDKLDSKEKKEADEKREKALDKINGKDREESEKTEDELRDPLRDKEIEKKEAESEQAKREGKQEETERERKKKAIDSPREKDEEGQVDDENSVSDLEMRESESEMKNDVQDIHQNSESAESKESPSIRKNESDSQERELHSESELKEQDKTIEEIRRQFSEEGKPQQEVAEGSRESDSEKTSPKHVTSDQAYLTGASEDAHLGKGGKEGYVYDIESKSERWLEEGIKPALQDSHPRGRELEVKQRGTRPEYRIQSYDRELVNAAREIKDNPEKVREWRAREQIDWVSGLADAEGSAKMTGSGQPQFDIYSSELKKLQVAADILKEHDIHSGFYLPEGRNVWQMFMTGRENLERFKNTVNLRHPEKRRKLEDILS